MVKMNRLFLYMIGVFLLSSMVNALAVSFSRSAGYADNAFDLTISADEPSTIYYTDDGSIPSSSSKHYTGPIHITDNAGKPNNISMITETSPHWTAPNGEVYKATVIRAIAYTGNTSSAIKTSTYFVGTKFTVPILSINTNYNNLFDYYTGIYLKGFYWYNASNWSGTLDFHPANYMMEGSDWERLVHLEMFEANGTRVVDQDIGMRITGTGSRVREQKSLKFYAKKAYGASAINYKIFPDQNITKYERLNIRNGDDDERTTFLRDVLAHQLDKNTLLATEGYRPSVVFINGEYWGFYPLRDRSSQQYFAAHYGVNKDDVIILEDNAVLNEGVPGDEQPYIDMVEYTRTHDMSIKSNYDYIKTLMDTDDFIRYYTIQLYTTNTDWPHLNVVYWRLRTNGTVTNASFGQDGRWRWIMHDSDWTFGYQPGAGADYDMFGHLERETWASQLWRSLSKNEEFRDSFVQQTEDQLATDFSTNTVINTLNTLANGMAAEVPRQIDRWTTLSSYDQWQDNLEGIKQFARTRPALHRQHLANYFGLGGTAMLTIETEGSGKVEVNTLKALSYPWTAEEFKDVPVVLHAVPASGETFVGWEGAASGTNPEIKIVLTKDSTVRAVFEGSATGGANIWFSRKYPATKVSMSSSKTFGVEVSNPKSLALTIDWQLDGNHVQSSGLSYTLSSATLGSHTLKVTISAGGTTIEQEWNINVGQPVQTQCYNNVQSLPVNCTGTITSDVFAGSCRTVSCTISGGSVTAQACNKPNDINPTYYEVYRTASSGNPPQVCLGETCIQYNGYAHANLPACIAITNGTQPPSNQTNGTQPPSNQTNQTINQTCYSDLASIPATCTGGTISSDVFSGGRTITCSAIGKALTVQAWEKPDTGTKQYFEMYKKSQTGSGLKICLAGTCISDNGYAKSPNYPICIGQNATNATDTTPPIITNGYPTGILPYGSMSATVGVDTNENANCRISNLSGQPYSSMSPFTGLDGGTKHMTTVTGLQNSHSYNYYIKCRDIAGNINPTDYVVSFSVANQPSNQTNQTGLATLSIAPWYPQGMNYVFICHASGFNPTSYAWIFGDGHSQTTTADNVYHTYTANGTYNVKCTAINGQQQAIANLTVNVGITPVTNATKCIYNGTQYSPGDDYPALDGCNSCTCGSNGESVCTIDDCSQKVVLSIAPWYPQGSNYVFICHASGFNPTSYAWIFGDGHSQTTTADNVYHTYTANGSYDVTCNAKNSNISKSAMLNVVVG